ncbi:MAG: DUF2877 domain-containing protein [Bacillota bacterium]|nr:DUF2877 domain-containing protein [Bacillota bacterium]
MNNLNLDEFIELNSEWFDIDLCYVNRNYVLELHSYFKHAINFKVEEWPIMLVVTDMETGRGPSAIGLKNQDFARFLRIIKLSERIYLKERQLFITGGNNILQLNWREGNPVSFAPVYKNTPLRTLLRSSNLYAEMLKRIEIPSPAAVLLDYPGGEIYFRRIIADNFRLVILNIIEGNWTGSVEYIRNLSGLGRGLTPTGDDLIHSAFICAHYFIKDFSMKDIPENFISNINLKTNEFGRHMIELGRSGKSPEVAIKYIISLADGSVSEIYLNNLLAVGSTTGFDLALGIIYFIRILSSVKKLEI